MTNKPAFSAGRLRMAGVYAACLILPGCIETAQPSADTKYLETKVISRLELWAKSDSDAFSFAFTAAERGYEKICLIPQYWGLDSVEKLAGRPIRQYHSSFGNSVPENYGALVAIKGEDAHAALIQLRKVGLGTSPGKECISATTAKLRRLRNSPSHRPSTILE